MRAVHLGMNATKSKRMSQAVWQKKTDQIRAALQADDDMRAALLIEEIVGNSRAVPYDIAEMVADRRGAVATALAAVRGTK